VRYDPSISNPDAVPTKIEIPVSIVIIFSVGWIFILLGFLGNSAFLEYRTISVTHTYHSPVEPWYSVSTGMIGLGFMFLSIFHLLLFAKFKFSSSIATIPIFIVLFFFLIAIAQESLSEGVVIIETGGGRSLAFGFIMAFALGLHGYELFLLGRNELLLKILTPIIMLSGLPLFFIYALSRPFQTPILVLALLVLLIIINLYRLSLKGVWYFQDMVIPDPPNRTEKK
jgi:hypothetical protein